MFFGAATVGVIAVFIFSIAFFGGVQKARAYAIGSLPTDTGAGTASGSYDFGGSLQNLVSPFTGFIDSLKWNSNTTIDTHGESSAFPTVNLTPVVENGVQNILSQWGSEFDNWFYGVSGVHLSGIFYVLLNAIAWTLGLAQNVVNWLLGLFH